MRQADVFPAKRPYLGTKKKLRGGGRVKKYIIMLLILLCGCGHMPTGEKCIRTGMPEAEVIETLGEPEKKHWSRAIEHDRMWMYPDLVIFFQDGYVVKVERR